MAMSLTDMIGFTGVFIILIAYFLNIYQYLDEKSVWFLLMNCIGSLLAFTASWLINYLPFMILEGVWLLVSLVALVDVIRKVKIKKQVG